MENTPPKSDELSQMMQAKAIITDDRAETSVPDSVLGEKRKSISDGGVNDELEDMDAGKRKKVTPESLLDEIKEAMRDMADGKNLTEEKFVIQKTLVPTDCCRENSQLTITVPSGSFLKEMERLKGCDADGHVDCVLVKILGHTLEVTQGVHLRKLNEVSHDMTMYVLDGSSWDTIVKNHRLKEGMDVQLWSFKIDEELHFALVKLLLKSKAPVMH